MTKRLFGLKLSASHHLEKAISVEHRVLDSTGHDAFSCEKQCATASDVESERASTCMQRLLDSALRMQSPVGHEEALAGH